MPEIKWIGRQIAAYLLVNRFKNKLKNWYYGNFFIWNRRDSHNRCRITFMLSGCKT